MNLEELKKRVAKNTAVTLKDGSVWPMRKLSAATGIAIGKAFMAAGHVDPDGPEPEPQKLIDAYSLLLSKVLCDESGALSLDSDEGREYLQQLDLETILELGEQAQEICLGGAKKN